MLIQDKKRHEEERHHEDEARILSRVDQLDLPHISHVRDKWSWCSNPRRPELPAKAPCSHATRISMQCTASSRSPSMRYTRQVQLTHRRRCLYSKDPPRRWATSFASRLFSTRLTTWWTPGASASATFHQTTPPPSPASAQPSPAGDKAEISKGRSPVLGEIGLWIR